MTHLYPNWPNTLEPYGPFKEIVQYDVSKAVEKTTSTVSLETRYRELEDLWRLVQDHPGPYDNDFMAIHRRMQMALILDLMDAILTSADYRSDADGHILKELCGKLRKMNDDTRHYKG